MAIERKNSFHLMLSDDELTLLRLLAERDGLNASDYLRTLLRRDAGGASPNPLSRTRDVMHLLGRSAVDGAWTGQKALARTRTKASKSAKPR